MRLEQIREQKQHLLNIAETIKEIQSYAGKADYEEFAKNDMQKEEITQMFNQLGGAAKMIDSRLRDKYTKVDWEALLRFEDAMYNQGHEMSLQPLWPIMKNELPIIKDHVIEVAEKLDEEEEQAEI